MLHGAAAGVPRCVWGYVPGQRQHFAESARPSGLDDSDDFKGALAERAKRSAFAHPCSPGIGNSIPLHSLIPLSQVNQA